MACYGISRVVNCTTSLLGDANALLLAITNNIIMGAVRRVTFFLGGGGGGMGLNSG